MNFYAILLYKRETYIENDAFELIFQIYDELNDLVTDLSIFKFQCIITNDAYSVTKKDENYSGGSTNEISVSNDKVTVHIDADDTNNFDGEYVLEFQLENKTSGFRQTIFRKSLHFYKEKLEN